MAYSLRQSGLPFPIQPSKFQPIPLSLNTPPPSLLHPVSAPHPRHVCSHLVRVPFAFSLLWIFRPLLLLAISTAAARHLRPPLLLAISGAPALDLPTAIAPFHLVRVPSPSPPHSRRPLLCYIMLHIKTPKSLRAKRELEKRAPKLVEYGKKTLILHGTKTSNVLNAVLTEIYHLKKDNAVKYSRRNDNIRPFESGGETSLEFYSLKTDCSLFVYGSHSKKRPDNLVIGRTYDHHIYDLVEVGVQNFKSMASFSYDKKIAPLIGSKPFFAFIGEGFENVEELKHLKEVLLDLFRGQVVKNLNLAGLDRVYVCTAVSSNKVLFTHCALRLKKSGTIVPRMELVEVGPSMDLVVRRHRLPDESLKKEAMKIAPELTKKKEKNVSKDAIEGKIGKIYVPDQQVGNASLPHKPKGVKRERREAKAKGEDNKHKEKKQKQQQQDDASA